MNLGHINSSVLLDSSNSQIKKGSSLLFYQADGSTLAKIYSSPMGAIVSSVTTKVLVSNFATLSTAAPHGFFVGNTVTVAGVDSTFNGTFAITTVGSSTSFSYAQTHADVSSSAATGTASATKANPFFTDATTGDFDVWAPIGAAVTVKVDGTFLMDGAAKRLFYAPPVSSPYFNVLDFGAVDGGGPTKNKPAFIACQATMAASTNGGTFYTPEGVFDVGDFAFDLPQSATKAYHLKGAGPFSTFLIRSVEGGAGTYFGKATVTGGTVFSTISDMCVRGPGSFSPDGAYAGSEVWGQTNPNLAEMDGFRIQGGQQVSNVFIIEFKAGIVEVGDHISYHHVTSVANLDGIRIDAGTSRDDITHVDSNLTNNARSSLRIAAGSNNSMDGTTFLRGHNGFCPVGITIEAGDADGSEKIAGVHWTNTSWEGLGEAAILDEGMTSVVEGTISGGRPFSISNAGYGRPSSTAADMFKFGHVGPRGFHIDKGTYMNGFGSAPSRSYFNITTLEGPLTWDGSWWSTFAQSIVSGIAFIICPVPYAGVYLTHGSGNAGADYLGMEMVRAHAKTGTIDQGDLVEIATTGFGLAQRNAGTTVPAGVAINTPAVTSELVVVGEQVDKMLINFTATGTLAVTDVLVPLAGTPYKVTNIPLASLTAAQAAAKVGRANNATLTGGRVSARVRL